MIKDFLVSFTDNFKEKTKNPFLGTYLLVWLVRNWELVYTLFNFDDDCKLEDKKTFITNYYNTHSFLENLLANIYWSFGLLITTYFLINISRFIVNLSEKRLTPWVYKITDSNSIVLKSVFERIRTENDELQQRLDRERDSKSRLEIRIQSLENEITELLNKNEKKTISDDENKEKQIIKPNLNSILLNKLKDKNLLKDFISTTVSLNKGLYINNDYLPVNYFIELGLIKFKEENYTGNAKKYTITTEGEEVLKLARLE